MSINQIAKNAILLNMIFKMDHMNGLKVYSRVDTSQDIKLTMKTGFIYWSDAKNPQGFGPFRSIQECMMNYNAIYSIQNAVPTKKPINPPQGDLIRVDFVAKKRE